MGRIMGMLTTRVALIFCLMALLVHHQAHAQFSQQDYLAPHNQARSSVGVAPLQWDPTLEAYATNYANARSGDCALVHSGGNYGENIFVSSGGSNAGEAVQLWVNEKVDYYYDSNTCAAGKVCGHYTQVVWRKTERVGCGQTVCTNGGTFVVCSYDPPGNYVGEKPY